jgi:N-acetylneuraminic acid mutarotase
MPTASLGLRFAVAPNGKVYAIGGGYLNGSYVTNVEEYNPTTDTWTTKSAIPHPSGGMGVVTAPSGKIYAIGGGDGSFVDEYNPVTDTWTAKAPLPTPREDMGASLGSNGNIYVAGGAGNTGYTNAVEEYNPTTDTWTSRTGLPMPIYAVGLALGGDGNIYAIGGQATGDPILNTTFAGFTSVTPTPTIPTNKDQCKNSGWKNFTGPRFKNQGECVKFVNKNS